ncbi:MAG: ANTAR domain-containing protein [Pseudomonadota bacterium]
MVSDPTEQTVEPARLDDAPVQPLRVLVIDDDAERARQVEEGLADNAIVHMATHIHGRALLDLIADLRPDVMIMDCNSPDRDTIESLRQVAQANPKPIVMFVEEEGGEHMQEAIEAGVSAYVIDGLTPKRVRPLIDTAIARFKVIDGLRSELKKTKDDLAARKVIAKAKGLLMDRNGMTENEAFSAMRDMSQKQSKPLKDIAESIITILGIIADKDKDS